MSDSVGKVGNMAPIDINNQEIDSITLNGNTDIDTVEVNGQTVFSAVEPGLKPLANYTLSEVPSNVLRNAFTSNPDGTIFVTTSYNNSTYRAYSLSTPWDITTATEIATASDPEYQNQSIDFSSDGTILYNFDYSPGRVLRQNLSTPFDINTLSGVTQTAGTGANNGSGTVKQGGQYMFTGHYDNTIRQHEMSTPYDLDTMSQIHSINTGESVVDGVEILGDGTRLFAHTRNDKLLEYVLSTPWNLSTATRTDTRTYNFPNIGSTVYSLLFKEDGTIGYGGRAGGSGNYHLKFEI